RSRVSKRALEHWPIERQSQPVPYPHSSNHSGDGCSDCISEHETDRSPVYNQEQVKAHRRSNNKVDSLDYGEPAYLSLHAELHFGQCDDGLEHRGHHSNEQSKTDNIL